MIFNTIVLVFVLTYGLVFGAANWVKYIVNVLLVKQFTQSVLGKLLDVLWLWATVYVILWKFYPEVYQNLLTGLGF